MAWGAGLAVVDGPCLGTGHLRTYAESPTAQPAASSVPDSPPSDREASPSQRRAIEAEPRAVLVRAGPGAGKTYCLTERIHYLLAHHGVAPARICAFTFTNKAAGEIAQRLQTRLGGAAAQITSGTIHAFCASLLRAHGAEVGVEPGFGIADDEYQRAVLRRTQAPRHWHAALLRQFSAFRIRGTPLHHENLERFARYERYLARRNILDFDTLLLRTAELLERAPAAAAIRARWDVVLVDEFQDLNPVQYRIIHGLACGHGHVFAVGDDEQSIYSWAGADRSVFTSFVNDFHIAQPIPLGENHRCPHDVFALARALVQINKPIFEGGLAARAERRSDFRVEAMEFATDDAETAWLLDDIARDRAAHGHAWGDVALLYRTHEIGDRLEAAFLNAGIRCRLAPRHALADDPVIAYVLAAARVIAAPDDPVHRDAFFRRVLPRALYEEALARAAEHRADLVPYLRDLAASRKRTDTVGRQVRRALADWANLTAVGKQHTGVASLVQELLSRRVGPHHSVLDDRHDELSDPAALPDVVRLATRLRAARAGGAPVWIAPLGGAEIPIAGMLTEIGIQAVHGRRPSPGSDAECLAPGDVPGLGLALGVFKAAQLMEADDTAGALTSFTAIDLETTDRDVRTAEIVELAAVKVRDGRIVERFAELVKPDVPIAPEAAATHGLTERELRDAPSFAAVWPRFRAFCGDDVVAAHNGYAFDFAILERMAGGIGAPFDLCRYDTLPLARDLFPTSCKLVQLARRFGIPPGTSHRALDDTMTLVHVLLALGASRLARARKTALIDLLGHLGVALALTPDDQLGEEAWLFRDLTRPFALGRYSTCLDWYEREQAGDATLPSVDEIIERLGGAALMARFRTEKTADERYPAAMTRLRRLITGLPEAPLHAQLTTFLDRAALSQWQGQEPRRDSVNLLTLHSTKGLEFSRVYIVGAEDAQLPGTNPARPPALEEIEEARRLLYVGMTRTIDRLVLTCARTRAGKPAGGHQFLDEMGLTPQAAP